MGRILFYLIFLLQILTLVMAVMPFIGYHGLYYPAVATYVLSGLLMLVAILKKSRADATNCLTTVLFIINLLLLITYLFTFYLKGFLGQGGV